MNRPSFASVVLVALAWTTIVIAPAMAQRDRESPSASEIADRVDLRIAKLKADLRLNDDQAKNWSSVQSALHDIGVNRANRYFQRDQRIDARRGPDAPRDWSSPPPHDAAAPPPDGAKDRDRGREPDAVDRMRKEADYLTDRAVDLRKLADAASPLYSSLGDGQRRRFMEFLRKDRDDEREMMRDRSR
jgi:hypothetical protein